MGRKLLKEPLVHFLALGALLFGIGLLRDDRVAPGSNRIAITPGVVERLVEAFRRTWQRPPTEDEFRGLVVDHLKEEVLYREALAMGLERDDQIIRRRLRQKIEFLTTDVVESFEPTDEEMGAYLQANADRYRQDVVLSFTQIYLRAEPDPAQARARARAMLDDLEERPDADPAAMGDPFLHPTVYRDRSVTQLSGLFGPEFASQLVDLPVGEWSEPVTSPFGLHLARLDALEPGRPSSLDEVRDAVHRDLMRDRRRDADKQYFTGLLSQYTVTMEWPDGMEPIDIPGVWE